MGIAEALGRVVPTPEGHRLLIDEREAGRRLRCGQEDLALLGRSSFAAPGRMFDVHDIGNLGLASGSGRTRPELEMVFFARMLRSRDGGWTAPRSYAVEVVASCPRGPQCDGSDWSHPRLAGARWNEAGPARGSASWRGTIDLRGRDGVVRDRRIRRVWEELTAGYRFQFTPRELAGRTDITRSRGVGDCAGLSRLLTEMLAMTGVRARVRIGHLFGGLMMREHHWVEAEDVDRTVVSLDPSMALLAGDFFTSEYAAFCLGSRLNRVIPLEGHDDLFVTHIDGYGTEQVRPEIRLRPVRQVQDLSRSSTGRA